MDIYFIKCLINTITTVREDEPVYLNNIILALSKNAKDK